MTRGLIVAAAASHSGKTTIATGLIAAFRARGVTVAAAKCGPDYIDPKFLQAASGRAALNLDSWAMPPASLQARLARQAAGSDLVIVEGVMGLYDGGLGGIGSTASLAAATGLTVLLVVGAQGTAQSAAAVAEGCARLADGFAVIGTVANNVASDRHADLLREGFARTSVPLLGLVRSDPDVALPSRHLGLVQAEEHEDLARKIERAGAVVAKGCDLDAILAAAVALRPPFSHREKVAAAQPDEGVRRRMDAQNGVDAARMLRPLGQRIAVAHDIAFAFSYPHLLADWSDQGAELSFFSPLADEAPAQSCDAVFLPGGYPELHAGRIAAAGHFRAGMEGAVGRGALVYGECGGYMALGESLTDAEGQAHRMLGLLPLATSFELRKLHLGYRRLRPLRDLPWSEPLSAHEFHFASIVAEGEGERLFQAETPDGAPLGPIGLRRARVMGSFAHVIDAAAG